MYLSVQQAAEKLNVCKKTIYRRIKDGTLPVYKIGEKLIRIKPEDLEKIFK